MTIDDTKTKRKILGFPHKPASGGPGTFQVRLTDIVTNNGYEVVFSEDKIQPDVVFVIGGSKKLWWIWRAKRKGAKVLHRLDGLNWRHRYDGSRFQVRIAAEIRNMLLMIVRNYLADVVIYQSDFIKSWWYRVYGPAKCQEHIIHNGTNLEKFSPNSESQASTPQVLCVEGSIQDNTATLKVLDTVAKGIESNTLSAELVLCGSVSEGIREALAQCKQVSIKGKVPRQEMPDIFRRAAVFLVLEINPPCPNAVIEALASGLPVVGYDTGALAELVPPDAGVLVDYKTDPWNLDEPDTSQLVSAIQRVLDNLQHYQAGARRAAEQRYNMQDVTAKYLAALQ